MDYILLSKNEKQIDFAKKLKIAQSHASRLIADKAKPSERLIDDICETYSVNRAWLLDESDEPWANVTDNDFVSAIIAAYNLSGPIRSVVEIYLDLSDEQRTGLARLVEMVRCVQKKAAPQGSEDDLSYEQEQAISTRLAAELAARLPDENVLGALEEEI